MYSGFRWHLTNASSSTFDLLNKISLNAAQGESVIGVWSDCEASPASTCATFTSNYALLPRGMLSVYISTLPIGSRIKKEWRAPGDVISLVYSQAITASAKTVWSFIWLEASCGQMIRMAQLRQEVLRAIWGKLNYWDEHFSYFECDKILNKSLTSL